MKRIHSAKPAKQVRPNGASGEAKTRWVKLSVTNKQ